MSQSGVTRPMVEGPLVSVVVPTFNRTRYLTAALESALAQTYTNTEILVTDDASTEDVYGEVVSRFDDTRIKYHRNPKNLGMGLNTWTALTAASGKYVATLHDDDLWERDFLASLVPALEKDDSLSVAFSDHQVIDENGALDSEATEANTRRWQRDLLVGGVVRPFLELAVLRPVVPAAMAAVFRKSAVDWDDFPPEVGTFYDQWLTYLSARTGAAGYYDPRRLTRYRVHRASETLAWAALPGRLRALKQAEFLHRRYLQDQALSELRPSFEPQYVRIATSLAMALLEDHRGEEARLMLARAHEIVPRPELKLMMIPTWLPSVFQRSLSLAARRVSLLFRDGP